MMYSCTGAVAFTHIQAINQYYHLVFLRMN